MSKIITRCSQCWEWSPTDSYGCGSYCDELGEKVSDDNDCDIPENCPIKDVKNPAIKIIEDEIEIIQNNISLHIAPHSSAYAKNVLTNMLNKIKEL